MLSTGVMPIPCPHFKITIVKRSQGQSAVAGAAYQSGERLFSEYDQKTKFYNKKKELVHAEIVLPSHAPPGFADRATLWNAVEAVENQWNSQLARRIVLAFPVEVPKEQYLKIIREFCQEQFVSKGMIADFAIHDKGDGNPHAHILLTLRAMDEHGRWLPKARKVYDLDENGERIRLPSGNWKCHKENTMDWNDQKYAEVWRHSWETITNRYLEAAGRPERVDLRSFERQGIQQIPTVHLGPAAHQMEKRGVETFLGNLNRDIRAANSLMQSIRSAIRGLQRWIADLNEKKQLLLDALEKAKEPTLSDLLVDYFNFRNEQRSDWSGKAKLKCTVRDFEEVKRAVDYLKTHSLNTIEDLDTAISNLNQTAAPLRRQLKQNEDRMRAIVQIKDAAAVHAKLKPIHDTFIKKNFKLTKDAYAAQHKDELDTFNKAAFVKPDATGRVPVQKILNEVTEHTLAVSLMHVNNETGIIQPVEQLGNELEKRKVLFHVDATQSCGKLVEEIKKMKYDMLSFSAHKLGGPQGIGVLVLRKKNYKLPPVKAIMYGGPQEHGIRPGTVPVALVAGCGKACEIAELEYIHRAEKLKFVKDLVLQMLGESGLDFTINGDQNYCMNNTLNVCLHGVSSEALMILTKQYCGISNGSACTSKSYSPSYVLLAMGVPVEQIENSVRISWGGRHRSGLTESRVLKNAFHGQKTCTVRENYPGCKMARILRHCGGKSMRIASSC